MNPVLGTIFDFIGLVAGVGIFVFESRRRKLNQGMTVEVMLVGITAGVVIATLVERVVEHVPLSVLISYTAGGRTVIGGVVGGWLTVEWYKRRYRIHQPTGSLWALAMPAGEFFGRIGCWFNGCCYGRVTTLPWAVHQHDAMRHPTQLLMAAASLATFLIVWKLRDRDDTIWIYLVLWSGSRFFIELLREPVSQFVWLTPAVCLGLFGFGLMKLLAVRNDVIGEGLP